MLHYLYIHNTYIYIYIYYMLFIYIFELMNCFCGMVDRRKSFSLISSRVHCERSSPSRISDTSPAGLDLRRI